MEIQRIRKFSSRVISEEWKSKEFVQLSGDFRRMEIQRIHSALGFSSRVTSEEWNKPSFVRLAFEFRRTTKNQDSSRVSRVSAFGYWALDRFPLRTYIEQIR
ncbi:unnamed protein product [Rhizophagus irregularis]|nr:unnamed protein product [Rhizophagus irregularis]